MRAMRMMGPLAAFALGLTCVAAPADAAEKIKVTYPTLTSSFIFFFSALSKGYYAEEGIEPEVIEAAGGVATPALVSGNVQFSTSGSAALSVILKGAHLKVLLVGEDRPSWQIWSTRPEIKTLADLKGQQIGVLSRGDTGEVAIRYVLKKNALPDNFVSFTPMGSSLGTRMAVVRSSSLPAAVLQPAEIETLREGGGLGNAHLVLDLAQGVRMTFNGLATSDDMIKSHPDTVLRFVRATRKGMIYARDNRAGAIEVFVKAMKAQPDAAARGYDELRKVMAQDGTIGPDAQTGEIALRGEMLGLAKDKLPPPSAVFDFAWAEKVNAELTGWVPSP